MDLPELPKPEETANAPPAAAEAVRAGYDNPPTVRHSGHVASYNPATGPVLDLADRQLQERRGVYLCLWNDLAHRTGHPNRLNPPDLTVGRYSDTFYAREKLTAAIASAMMAARTEAIAPDVENSAAYISNWLIALHNDKHLVILAAGRAQRAADHIFGARKEVAQPQQFNAARMDTPRANFDGANRATGVHWQLGGHSMPYDIPSEYEPDPAHIPASATDIERFPYLLAITRLIAERDDPIFCKQLYDDDRISTEEIVEPLTTTSRSTATNADVQGVDHRTYFANEFRLPPPRVIEIAPGITVQGGVSGGDTLYFEVVDPDKFGHEDATLTSEQRTKLGSLAFTEQNNTRDGRAGR